MMRSNTRQISYDVRSERGEHDINNADLKIIDQIGAMNDNTKRMEKLDGRKEIRRRKNISQ